MINLKAPGFSGAFFVIFDYYERNPRNKHKLFKRRRPEKGGNAGKRIEYYHF